MVDPTSMKHSVSSLNTKVQVVYIKSIRWKMKCSIQLGYALLNGTFHLSPHENICTIALINIHYLYTIAYQNIGTLTLRSSIKIIWQNIHDILAEQGIKIFLHCDIPPVCFIFSLVHLVLVITMQRSRLLRKSMILMHPRRWELIIKVKCVSWSIVEAEEWGIRLQQVRGHKVIRLKVKCVCHDS